VIGLHKPPRTAWQSPRTVVSACGTPTPGRLSSASS